MPVPHVETAWYLSIPVAYRDRVQWDPVTGYPTCIDVAAGAYTVTRELTDADRRLCGLPDRYRHEQGWR